MAFNRLNHSIIGEIRPRFYLKSHAAADDLKAAVAENFELDKTVIPEITQDLILLKIPKNEQHYWSPELTVRFENNEYIDYTRVCCLAGPKQSVWLMFTFIYAFIGLATLFAGMFGLVKYSTSGSTAWLWSIPVGLFLISTIFVSAKIGQRKGRDQTLHLVSFLYHSLVLKGALERVERK